MVIILHIILIVCIFMIGFVVHKQITPKPYIRISRDYDAFYNEYLNLCKSYKGDLTFRDFLIIRYDLWGSPLKYANKLILFGFVKNKLQVIAMLNKKEDK